MRRDAWVTLLAMAAALLGMEMILSFAPAQDAPDRVPAYLAMCAMIAALAVRRRFPIASILVLSALFIGFGTGLPTVTMQPVPQIAYFVGLY